ncbi:MAG: PaaI family thioesterase [Bdellovibrionota bacterium]
MSNPVEMIMKMYPAIPFQKLLGIQILETAPDKAKILLPFRPELAGGGNAYHGGVISSLIDLTGALAAWSGHDAAKGMKASTVTLTVQFLSAAQGEDVVAEGRAIKRGKELIFCDIDVSAKTTGKAIATGVMVYRIAQ